MSDLHIEVAHYVETGHHCNFVA